MRMSRTPPPDQVLPSKGAGPSALYAALGGQPPAARATEPQKDSVPPMP